MSPKSFEIALIKFVYGSYSLWLLDTTPRSIISFYGTFIGERQIDYGRESVWG